MRRIIVETITIIPLVRLFKDRTQDWDTKAFIEGHDHSFAMESKLIYQKKAILISLLTVLLLSSPALHAQDPISLDKVNYIALSPEAAALHDAVNYPVEGNLLGNKTVYENVYNLCNLLI